METLSQLMPLGNRLPQIKENYCQYDYGVEGTDYPVIGTCALGGIIIQVFGNTFQTLEGPYSRNLSTRLREYFDLPETLEGEHPVTHECLDILAIVGSLNDEHDWSRAQIADWLESVGY
jgi:hypothetical protein